MKSKLASVLGLAVFVTSLICGGSLVYAETEETSSVTPIIAPVDEANGAESELSCLFDGAGADICTMTARLEGVDAPLTVGGRETSAGMQIAPVAEENGAESNLSCAFDSSGADICTVLAKLEEVDEPLAVGGQETASVMQIIAAVADANGAESELSCVLDSAGADICTITAKIEEVDAIVVEVSQSATVADSGSEVGNREEPQHTGSILEPATMLDSRKD